jgi:hypothetical protein
LELGEKSKNSNSMKFFTFFYKFFADYGYSFMRPLAAWIALILVCWICLVIDNGLTSISDLGQSALTVLKKGLPLETSSTYELMPDLVGGKQIQKIKPIDLPNKIIESLFLFEKIASLILWFLFALGIRNSYKIK